MRKRRWDQTRLAEALQTSSGTVSRWLYGERTPTAEYMKRMQDALGVPMELWAKSPTTSFHPPANDAPKLPKAG